LIQAPDLRFQFELCCFDDNKDIPVSTPDWKALLDAGIRAMRQQKPDQALWNLERAYQLAPAERLVRYWLGNASRVNGNGARAEQLYDELLEGNVRDIDTAFAKAFLLREQGRSTDAAATLLTLVNALPRDLETQLKVAGFLRDMNHLDEAISVCEQAISTSPERADLRFKTARLYLATGKFDDAITYLQQALAIDPGMGSAWLGIAQLHRFTSIEDKYFIGLENASLDDLTREAEMCIAFARGKANDDLQRWPEAWQQFTLGNNIHKKENPWDQEKWNRTVSHALKTPTSVHAPANSRRPVFIVGMIRAGTTLLEQRLDRHPDITGRGELNFLAHMAGLFPDISKLSKADKATIADEIWTQMRLQGPQEAIYIDKNPLNFRFLNFLFAVLPEAKVIHIHRDGRDSCLSSYFQLFQHPDTGFSNDLNHTVDYYRGYRRLMAYWQSQFPERIHNISYVELVESTRSTLAGVLEFVGANWDEAVMETGGPSTVVRTASAWQARQPLYRRSLGRWKNYYDQAPEFFDAIAWIDQSFG
jgi:tetratricopeptide (TPR) repeat protein